MLELIQLRACVLGDRELEIDVVDCNGRISHTLYNMINEEGSEWNSWSSSPLLSGVVKEEENDLIRMYHLETL